MALTIAALSSAQIHSFIPETLNFHSEKTQHQTHMPEAALERGGQRGGEAELERKRVQPGVKVDRVAIVGLLAASQGCQMVKVDLFPRDSDFVVVFVCDAVGGHSCAVHCQGDA